MDLELAYDRAPREELGFCMREPGVAENYVRLVQVMYESSITLVSCAVGVTGSRWRWYCIKDCP